MKRRTFLQSSAVAAASLGLTQMPDTAAGADTKKTVKREYYELRTYFLKAADQQKLLDDYLEKALIPALNRLGVKPVGAFIEAERSPELPVYVVIPYASVEQFTTATDKLAADAQYQSAGAPYLGVEAANPVYTRIESTFLVAFEGMPRMEVPPRKSRLFQLRIYESHNERAGKKKIEMFNSGEIDIFRRVGLTPVFFGESLLGTRLPNLTYLLTFDDKAELDANWNVFRKDPAWLKLKAIPEYADAKIVSKITNKILHPLAYSQI
ncbi:MAG: NIPSNAP family protein [Verrucomicrobiota bacterium]